MILDGKLVSNKIKEELNEEDFGWLIDWNLGV